MTLKAIEQFYLYPTVFEIMECESSMYETKT